MIIFYFILLFIIIVFLFSFTGLAHFETDDYKTITPIKYLKGGEPFELIQGERKAVLFIHGFPGSPKMYHLVKNLAVKDGYDVYCPLLPGFGTNHDDFIKSNFTMWFKYICDYYKNIRNNYDKFYIVGNSMGGALTLKLAQEFSGSLLEPTAIATVAAPVFITRFSKFFTRIISLFSSYIPSKKPLVDKSKDQDGETEWVGYKGLFPKQVFSLLLGLKMVKKDLYKVSVPCYLCHAKEDKTVSYKNLSYIADRISSKKILVKILRMEGWKHSNHSLFIYKSYYKQIWSDIEYFFRSL